jgi:ABC-type nitrate/sulfonate/bicarbonate transport system substrate-binding protein
MIAPLRLCGWAGIAAIAVCVAAAPAAAADIALTVGKANPTSDAIIPVNVGDQLGIFKKRGLDLKIIDFGGGSKMVQGLTAGAIDIGDGAGTEMAFVAKGAPMVAVCESTGPAPFLGIGVPWDSPVKKLDDLKGKVIGVSSPGSFSDWSAHELARKFGWGEDGVKTVGIGGGSAPTIAALRTHLVDAAIAGASVFLASEEVKEGRLATKETSPRARSSPRTSSWPAIPTRSVRFSPHGSRPSITCGRTRPRRSRSPAQSLTSVKM